MHLGLLLCCTHLGSLWRQCWTGCARFTACKASLCSAPGSYTGLIYRECQVTHYTHISISLLVQIVFGLQVAMFKKLAATSNNIGKWVYLDTRRPHTHDVRAMLLLTPPDADSLLLTGGNDAQLFAYSVPHFQTVRHSPCVLYSPHATLSPHCPPPPPALQQICPALKYVVTCMLTTGVTSGH